LRGLEIAQRALDGLVMEARVLGVEQGVVAAGVLQDVADARGRELDDEMAELQVPAPRHRLQALCGHLFPSSRLSCPHLLRASMIAADAGQATSG
jgi:hypothetical protein